MKKLEELTIEDILDMDYNNIISAVPYLMEDKEFIKNVKRNPKIFSGFSDTTI